MPRQPQLLSQSPGDSQAATEHIFIKGHHTESCPFLEGFWGVLFASLPNIYNSQRQLEKLRTFPEKTIRNLDMGKLPTLSLLQSLLKSHLLHDHWQHCSWHWCRHLSLSNSKILEEQMGAVTAARVRSLPAVPSMSHWSNTPMWNLGPSTLPTSSLLTHLGKQEMVQVHGPLLPM